MNNDRYFDSMFFELNFLRSKIYDVVCAIEKMPGGANGRLTPQLSGLNFLVDHLSERCGQLWKECAKGDGANKNPGEEINWWQAEISELTFLKVKISDIIRVVGKMPDGASGKLPPLLPRLNFLADHLSKSIGQLWKEHPANRDAVSADRESPQEWAEAVRRELAGDFAGYEVEPVSWVYG